MNEMSNIIKKNLQKLEDTCLHNTFLETTEYSKFIGNYYKSQKNGRIYHVKTSISIEEAPSGSIYIPGVDLSPYSL